MTCEQIKNYIDKYSKFDISTSSREQHYIKYRSIYYFLAYKYGDKGYSLSVIAKPCKVDRNTVRHGLKTFESFALTDSDFRLDFYNIKHYVHENTPKETIEILDDLQDVSNELLRVKLMRSTIKNKKQRLKLEKLKRIIKLNT